MDPNDAEPQSDPRSNYSVADQDAAASRQQRPRGDAPREDRDHHGITAEDAGGVGFGEEGFRAEGYPGNNPLQGESERDQKRRHSYAWTWPQPTPEALARTDEGAAADRRICEEIGQRILRAEPDLGLVNLHVLDGHVTLEGEVAESKDKQVVEALAESVEGVRSVESTLSVRSARTSAG
jgi:osmotically-inducible protein OsmY